MNGILVVCVGNICRSPMAQGLLANALPAVAVTSAGTNALVGVAADATARKLMHMRGIDIEGHRARQVTRSMCLQADLVLTMDTDQRRYLEDAYPNVCGKVFRLGEHAKRDIADPYRMPEEAFLDALALIEDGVHEWLHRIKKL